MLLLLLTADNGDNDNVLWTGSRPWKGAERDAVHSCYNALQ